MTFQCVVREHVNAAPAAVFAVASDFPRAAERISGIKSIEMLTPGPVGVGTTFREARVMFGKEAVETMEVIDFQPGRSYTLRAFNCGCEYRTTVSVRPEGGGSEIAFDFQGTPRTTTGKVMSALMGWMMKGMCVKAIRQDLTDLRAAVEKGAA